MNASHPLVGTVRAFNRFYTRRIGALGEGHLQSPFSLTEVRVLYELAHRRLALASDLSQDLGLDAGYLSRILQKFQKRGLLSRKRSTGDARQIRLSLTGKGREVFAPLDRAAGEAIAAMLTPLSPAARIRLGTAIRDVQEVLGAPPPQPESFSLRRHRPGDMGWVIHRHGVLYFQEYGWDERFEALVAEIAAGFIQNFDPQRERCWIAEKNGEIVGSVFLVKKSEYVAKLRLLLVEPSARGHGIGQRLVGECVQFARAAGYRAITLWTQNILRAAVHIYQKAGFRLVAEESHADFGAPMISQTWELTLRP